MEVLVKTRKLGGSLIVTIPNDAVKKMELKENETVSLSLNRPKKSYFGIAPNISAFTEKNRFDYRPR